MNSRRGPPEKNGKLSTVQQKGNRMNSEKKKRTVSCILSVCMMGMAVLQPIKCFDSVCAEEEPEETAVSVQEEVGADTDGGPVSFEQDTAEEKTEVQTAAEWQTEEAETGEGTADNVQNEISLMPEERTEEENGTDWEGETQTELPSYYIWDMDETWAEGDDRSGAVNMPMMFSLESKLARAAETVTGAAFVSQLLTHVGKGYSQENRYSENYFDCSSLVQRSLAELGVTEGVPSYTGAWYDLCSGMTVGSSVSFAGSGGTITYQLTAKNTDVLSNPTAFSVPGTIMVFIEQGATTGHVAVSLGSIPRQTNGMDPNSNASGIVAATENYLREQLIHTYGADRNLMYGNNELYGRPNVFSDSRYLGTDMNLGNGYSGPYNSIYRVDALNTTYGVSVNNLITGKSGSNVMFVLTPEAPKPMKGKAEFHKQGIKTSGRVNQARFALYTDEGCTNQIGEFVTDANGNAVTELDEGIYYCKEKEAPAGYKLDPDKVWKITVTADASVSQILENQEWSTGTVNVRKTDQESGMALSGAVFSVQEWSEAAGNYEIVGTMKEGETGIYTVGEYTVRETGVLISDGKLYYTDDNRGKFRIEETEAPDGYHGSWIQEFILAEDGQEFFFSAENIKKTGQMQLRKYGKNSNGEKIALSGAVFGVYTSAEAAGAGTMENQETAVCIWTTDENGWAGGYIPVGSYWVKELQAPAGYVLDHTVYGPLEVGMGEALAELAVKDNLLKNGMLSVEKADGVTGNPLSGAVYTIYTDQACIEAVGKITIEEGKGTAELPCGVYYLKETTVPYGYQLDETVYGPYSVGGPNGDVKVQKICEEEQKIRISLRKEDAQTGKNAQGEASLKGAVFELRAAEDIVHPDQHTGVVYRRGDTVATLITDKRGMASAEKDDAGSWLHCGKYELVEVQAPEGYIADSRPHPVDASYREDGKTEEFILYDLGAIENQVIRQAVVLYKLGDDRKDSTIPLQGIGFRFYRVRDILEANQVSDLSELPFGDTGIDMNRVKKEGLAVEIGKNGETELFTDEAGRIETTELIYGTYLVEESVTNQYYTACAPFIVRIPTVSGGAEETGGDSGIFDNPQKITVMNQNTKVYLKLVKTDGETGKKIPLAGAAFRLIGQDNAAVKQTDAEGNETDIFYTDEEGCVCLPEVIYGGRYMLEEIAAPEGYALMEEEIPITIDKSGVTYMLLSEDGRAEETKAVLEYTESGEMTANVTVRNYPTRVQISKTDIVSGEEIKGAELSILKKDENGELRTVTYRNEEFQEVKAEWITDGEPHLIERLPAGEYILREIAAPSEQGYTTAEDVAFTVEADYSIRKVIMNDSKTILSVSKQDITTGEELPGATLIISEKETGKEIERFVSEESPHEITGLVPGMCYVLTEITAPDGYDTAEAVEFTVQDTREMQKVVMKDKRMPLPKTPDEPMPVVPGRSVILGIEDYSSLVGAALLAAGSALIMSILLWGRKKNKKSGRSSDAVCR